MSDTPDQKSDTEEDGAVDEDEVLRRMLNTPPKPHKEDKVESKEERAKTRSSKD